MRAYIDGDDLFLEMERGFLVLEKLDRPHQRVLCVRRMLLTSMLAAGTLLLAIVLGIVGEAGQT